MAPPRAHRSPAGAIRQLAGGVRGWAVWSLRPAARVYITAVVGLAFAATVAALATAPFHETAVGLGTYLALLGCGVIAVESTRASRDPHGSVQRDLQTVWYLAIAVTFPPVFAIVAPIPLGAYRLLRQRRALTYRRVFSSATIILAYGAASLTFHAAPAGIAGPAPGTGLHATAWAAVAVGCGTLAWLINNSLLAGGIRLAIPEARLRDYFGQWRGLVSDLIELTMAVTLALLVAIDPLLIVLALPTVVLYRRSLYSAQLVAQVRIDAGTGVLTASAWRAEAEAEVAQALRRHTPLAIAMIEIDHFSGVGETAGPGAAGQVLRRIATILTGNLPPAAQAGRVGAGEFAVVLPGVADGDARRVGERVRDEVAGQPIEVEAGGHAGYVFRPTVSVGIACLDRSIPTVTGLVGAASSARAAAKGVGGNSVRMAPRAEGSQDRTATAAARAASR